MKSFKIRDHFFLHMPDGSVLAGPAIVELDEKTAMQNAHMLEEVIDDEPKKKKPKRDD